MGGDTIQWRSRQVAVTVSTMQDTVDTVIWAADGWRYHPVAFTTGSSNGLNNARYCRYSDMSCWWVDTIQWRSQQVAVTVSTMQDTVDTVLWDDDGWRYPTKYVEQFTVINKLYIVASCWIITETYYAMHGPLNIKFILVIFVTICINWLHTQGQRSSNDISLIPWRTVFHEKLTYHQQVKILPVL